MERLGEAKAGFRSLTEAIDITTPAGRMMMQMVGAFAAFERAMLKERSKAGLDAAREEGRIGGRRQKLSLQQQAEIRKMVSKGDKTVPMRHAYSRSTRRLSVGSSSGRHQPRRPNTPNNVDDAMPDSISRIPNRWLGIAETLQHPPRPCQHSVRRPLGRSKCAGFKEIRCYGFLTELGHLGGMKALRVVIPVERH
jgi:hypothetical protein